MFPDLSSGLSILFLFFLLFLLLFPLLLVRFRLLYGILLRNSHAILALLLLGGFLLGLCELWWFLILINLFSRALFALRVFRDFLETTESVLDGRTGVYRGRDIRAVAFHIKIIRIDTVEFSGVDLDIGAHFAKVESALIITLILVVAPREAVIPCVVV